MSEEVTTKGAGKINQKVISKSKDGGDISRTDNLNMGISKETAKRWRKF